MGGKTIYDASPMTDMLTSPWTCHTFLSIVCYESVVVVIDSGGDRLNVLVGNQFCGGDLPPCKSRH